MPVFEGPDVIPLGAYSNMMSLVMITVNNYIKLPTSHTLFFFFLSI